MVTARLHSCSGLVNKYHHLALPLAYNVRPLQPPQRMPEALQIHLGDHARYQREKRESGLSREAQDALEKDMVKKARERGVVLIVKPAASKRKHAASATAKGRKRKPAASATAKGGKRKPAAAGSADGGKRKPSAAAAAGGKGKRASAASDSSADATASAAPAAASPPRERAAAVSAAAPVSAAASVSSRGRPLIEKRQWPEGDD